MNYLIDKKVIFSPKDGWLTGYVEKTDVRDVLPRPSVRLLKELINKQGEIISRAELLELVWGKYGAVPSEAALNNHISIIRKRFNFWGVDRNKLHTVPRQGVILDADIEVILLQQDITTPEASELEAIAEEVQPTAPVYSRGSLTFISLGVFIFILLTLFTTVPVYNKATPIASRGKLDQCNIKPLGNTFASSDLLPLEKSEQLIAEWLSDKDCSTPQDVYISVTQYNERYSIFMVSCKLGPNDNYLSCREHSNTLMGKP